MEQARAAWRQEFEKNLQKWQDMTEEQKNKYIHTVFKKFEETARENRQAALILFLKWLQSPQGAIAFPYLWKDEYRQTMIDIIYHAMRIFYKVVGVSV